MLKVVLCITIAVAATYAWDPLESVIDPAQVGTGAAITYGGGKVWGVFPTRESEETYLEYYDPNDQHWHLPDDYVVASEWLEHTAITYQWMESGVVFIVGVEDGDPMLYWYKPSEDEWDYEEIEEFYPGAGASVAFRPNPNYNAQLYPIPGWLYCLAGGSNEFWQYWIPSSLGPVAVDGIYPGQGAVIADRTPVFLWEATSPTSKYRLIVARDPGLTDVEIDAFTEQPSYQTETRLANGVHYWRTASWSSSSNEWVWSTVHSFTLQGGWTRLEDITTPVGDGAALAYGWDSYHQQECLLAFIGDGGSSSYRYVVSENTWYYAGSSQTQNIGAAIANHKDALTPWAIFGQNSSDSLWRYSFRWGWKEQLNLDDFPQPLGPGASLAYSVESGGHYLYLTIGEDASGIPRNDFYRQPIPVDDGGDGTQTGSAQPAPVHARLINGPGEVLVEYELNAPGFVKATVFDATGRLVRMLHSGSQPAGSHRLSFSPDASGAYFILLDTGQEQARLKVVVR